MNRGISRRPALRSLQGLQRWLLPGWRWLQCALGWHSWCYSVTEVDAVGRPTARCCLRCPATQERRYNGYSAGGYGGWERQR